MILNWKGNAKGQEIYEKYHGLLMFYLQMKTGYRYYVRGVVIGRSNYIFSTSAHQENWPKITDKNILILGFYMFGEIKDKIYFHICIRTGN